jgi:ornithine cyclodeaminase/alanine dehydrogenase-like protein (mu-crystallin family)
MRILNAETIAGMVPLKKWTDTMEQALTAALEEDYFMPPRPHYDYQGNTLLLMPCFISDYFATKMVSIFPGNVDRSLPAVHGTVLLNAGKTGEPLAMLNGGKITALRTAAVGAVGVRHLASPDAKALGIVGAGVQGMHQVLMACQERSIKAVWVYDPNPGQVERFKAQVENWLPDLQVHPASSVTALLEKTQVVVTATTATQPVLPDDGELLAGKTFIGIGSYKPDMQELPDALFQMAETVFCDTDHALHETGDLINPLEKGIIREEQVVNAGHLIINKVRKPDSKVQIWKSVGMALFDLFAVVMLYEEALSRGVGQVVEV